MSYCIFLIFFIFLAFCKPPEYACQSIGTILRMHKYTFETHSITTEDGYILTVHRITGNENINQTIYNSTQIRKPVVLQHGISASGNNFVANGYRSPAMFYFDQGFDVWLPNVRGSQYSEKHVKYNFHSEEYWNFSFEELGTKDTKAYIDYIYHHTGQKVIYLGFSRGFMQMMAGFSLEPEFFRARISKIMGWAPVVRMDFTTNFAIVLAGKSIGIDLLKMLKWFGVTHMPGFNYETCMSGVNLCDKTEIFCKLRLLMSGDFLPYYDSEAGQTYGAECTSLKDLLHIVYNIKNSGFYRYPIENGELIPYNLSNIKGVPISIVVGEADMLAPPANAKWLEKIFAENGNPIRAKYYKHLGHQTFLIPRNHFDHLFIFRHFIITKNFFLKICQIFILEIFLYLQIFLL